MMAGLSVIMTGTFAFAPLMSLAQVENTATVLAGLKQQVRMLQEMVASLQARFAALGRSSIAQVGAGVVSVAGLHATSSPDTTFVINDTTTSTFRLGAANPSRAYTQSFKAPMDGKLKQVRFFVVAPQNGNPTKPINVSVRGTLAGPVITNETIIPNMPVSKVFEMPTEVVVDFTNPVTLQKDTTYYIEYSVVAPYDSKNYYRLLVGGKNPYKDGMFFHANGQQIAVYDMTMSVVIGSNVVTGGELKISPVQGLDKIVVAGGVGEELARFTFDATHAQEDIKIAMAQVFADILAGDLDNFQSLQFFDGSTALNTGSNVVNMASTPAGTDKAIVFSLDSPGLMVPKGTIKNIVLKGNVTSGANGNKVKFDFSGPLNPDFWRMAYIPSGTAVPLNISGIPGSAITIVKNGGWSVELAPSAPASEFWVPAGTTSVTLNVLRFRATTEAFALTNLRLQLKSPATAADIPKIYLYDNAGTLITSRIPSFVGGVEDFTFPTSGNGSFVIPADSFREMRIHMEVPKIGSGYPGTAGKPVAVNFDGSDTSKNKAVGMSSGMALHASTAAYVGTPGIRYFRSLPTVERLPLPVTALTSGNQVLYKFKVTADKAYDVALHKFTFSIATTGITRMSAYPANITLWNTTENRRVGASGQVSDDIAKAIYGSTGEYIRTIYADSTDLPSGQCTGAACWDIVPAGSVRTYELRADVTTDGSGDSVSTKLLGDSYNFIDPDGKVFMNSAFAFDQSFSSNFIWSDFSIETLGLPQSLFEPDWMNGYRVPWMLSTGLDSSTLSN